MPGRHLALLGGTTSYGDCLAALALLGRPWSLVEGGTLEEYERAFATRIGVAHGISFVSGRVGLYAILQAMGIAEGDEILLQVPTHIVVINAIRYAGARPVYVDCCSDSYNIDFDTAARRVSPRARVLLLQHTYGIPVNMNAACAFAQAHDLVIIEDCVHSLGATFAHRQTGSFGRAAFFSTEETKVISTSMGGIVVTDDDELAQRMRGFRDACCGSPGRWLVARFLLKLIAYQVLTEPRLHRYARAMYERLGGFQPLPRPVAATERVGERPVDYLMRFSSAQALMGLRQLRRLDRIIAHRRAIAEVYAQTFSALPPPARPVIPPHAAPSWCRYPLRVRDRSAVERALKPCAVPGTWFSSVLEDSASPAVGGYEPGCCPNAEAASGHVINLPTHGRVRPADAEQLAKLVRSAL